MNRIEIPAESRPLQIAEHRFEVLDDAALDRMVGGYVPQSDTPLPPQAAKKIARLP